MMTSTEEPGPSTLKQETKEAVLPWVSFDKSANNDLYKQERTNSLVRCSSCGKIYFHDHDENGGYDKNDDFMSLKPHEITKLKEPERKWLIIGCGPRKKPQTLLLDFTEETSEVYEEWYAFFCEKMGVEVPQRRNTENLQTMKKPKPKKRYNSAFLPSHKTVVELDDQHDQDNVFGEQNIASNHQQQETCHPSLRIDQAGFHNRAPGKDSPSSECSDSSDLSSFSSLKSRCSYNPKPEDLECTKDHLLRHQFTDYNDQIIVTRNVDGSKLHIGDRVAPRGAEGPTGMNAQGLREYIRTSDEENGMISLSITRGEEVTIREGELETNITFKGSKRPDTAEAVMRACSTDNQFDTYQTDLTIAEIDNKPVPVGTQCDQVTQMIIEALRKTGEVHLHFIPRSLMTVESDVDGDNRPEYANARPINVENNAQSSDEATHSHAEETDC
ncbi:uncharacterized protein LOC121425619 [Lytechinus variegatus]|uniref:uncharacterized protein LOC121425619 n=1 Tax=Lytechinus variegatus TaxID=7654 RepID=UPI001BB19730|nr:uncharacterized protein LOC121425619 [Lytechinus variegatus]